LSGLYSWNLINVLLGLPPAGIGINEQFYALYGFIKVPLYIFGTEYTFLSYPGSNSSPL
jgi:hypothetical protein